MTWIKEMQQISDTDDDDIEDGPLLSGTHSPRHRNKTTLSRKGRQGIYAATIFVLALALCFWLTAGRKPWARVQSSGPQRALIIASYPEQNTTWLKDVPNGWQIYRYIANSASSPGKLSGQSRRITNLPLQSDSGREALAYLTFIIDHYELSQLPSYMVFLHGHDRAWHQPERSVDKLRALNLTALQRHRYVPIRCSYDPICAPEGQIDLAAGPGDISFDELKPLPALWELCFDASREELPSRLASPRGAQFAVTAQAVRSRPLEFWKQVRAPLMTNDLGALEAQLKEMTLTTWGTGNASSAADIFGSDSANKSMSNEDLAAMYERMWHVLFGMETVSCLTERECRGTVYSNALACSRYEATPSQDWENVACAVDQEALKAIKVENEAVLKSERP